MKNHDLFKRTGIRITAAVISSMLFITAPAGSVFAAENTTGETAQTARTEEPKKASTPKGKPAAAAAAENPARAATEAPAEEEPKEDPKEEPKEEKKEESSEGNTDGSNDNTGDKDTPKDDGNEESGSGSGTEKPAKETPETGDTSGKEAPESGVTSEKEDSQDKDNLQSEDTGNTGSSSDSSSKNSTTPTKEASDKGETSADTGSGNTSIPASTEAAKDATGKDAVPASQKEQADDSAATVTAPEAKTKAKGKDLKEKKTELAPGETPTGYDQAAGRTGSNADLIASQNIVSGLSILNDDFRFHTVDKDLAISAKEQDVHEEMKSTSREVGTLMKGDVLYILSKERDGWLYIESGNVRGFVKKENTLVDEDADKFVADLQKKLDGLAKLTKKNPLRAEGLLHTARESVPAGENAAYTYKKCTTKNTVIDKEYAVVKEETSVREEADSSSRKIGRLAEGNLAYVITTVDSRWVYVESGNVRGFVKKSRLTMGSKAKEIVKKNGEANMATAEQYVEPEDNSALYYSLCSIKDGTAYSTVRSEIVQIASECIGNPYVWGGESLTYGADCSGFVQTLYSMFGYKIPRVADAQSQYGTQIPVSDAAPGDLIFFAANGYVYHVALYAGDGMTIEAYSEDRGIIATSLGNRDAVWATRVIED